jgi:uncharacterized protein YpbB
MDGLEVILLHMVDRIQGERSLAGCYHILKGKKSGQAIQDAALFGYQGWFGLFPKWERESFDAEVYRLILTGQLIPAKKSHVLSPSGKKELDASIKKYRFNERAFLAKNEGIAFSQKEVLQFWQRFQLLSQVISHFIGDKKRYHPIVSDFNIQGWVKRYWVSIGEKKEFAYEVRNDLMHALSQLEDELYPHLILDRLSGDGVSGRTFLQMSQTYAIPEALICLYYFQAISFLHNQIKDNPTSSLRFLIEEQSEVSPLLTHSTQKTYRLLQQGRTAEEVCQLRSLQLSTVEDHMIEIAIHVPAFDFSPYISSRVIEQVLEVSSRLKTRKLSIIKEELQENADYFQIRLALIKGRELDGQE